MNIRTFMLSAAALAASGAGAMAQDGDCDRQCLDGFLQQYLDAVIAHDPDAAPLMPGFRQTENGVAIALGEGVWAEMDGTDAFQRRIYDPHTSQTAMFGVMQHAGEQALVSVRLAVVGDQISEAEWNIVHDSDPGIDGAPASTMINLANIIENPPPEFRVVPEDERVSREALIGITESYFDGIQAENPNLIAAQPGCLRLENGFRVTGGDLNPTQHGGHEGKVDCTTQAPYNIAFVAARRYPVIDEEQQVSFALAVFLRDPGTFKRRNYFGEYFWMEDGKISEVYSAMAYVDPHLPVPNWPPYTGSFVITQETWNAR